MDVHPCKPSIGLDKHRLRIVEVLTMTMTGRWLGLERYLLCLPWQASSTSRGLRYTQIGQTCSILPFSRRWQKYLEETPIFLIGFGLPAQPCHPRAEAQSSQGPQPRSRWAPLSARRGVFTNFNILSAFGSQRGGTHLGIRLTSALSPSGAPNGIRGGQTGP